jgi:hypothetical protein
VHQYLRKLGFDDMDEQTELLREMRDLLRLIAEPALAKRDAKLREELLDIVGRSQGRAKAVLLMDGSRLASGIIKDAGIDQGGFSRLTTALRAKGLIGDGKQPKLLVSIPPNFFEDSGKQNG